MAHNITQHFIDIIQNVFLFAPDRKQRAVINERDCRASTVTTSNSKTAKAAKVKRVPSEPSGSKTSRLEVVAKNFTSAGFSKEVAERIARGKLRKSSLRIYDCQWNRFTKQISPWHATTQQIADFLLSQFQEGSLKVSTIDGYNSASVATLKPGGRNVGSDPHLC